jgi:carbonic anhydrase
MCQVCALLSRRQFLGGAAVATATALLGARAGAADHSPEEALQRLKAGNQKYVTAPQLCVADPAAARGSVAQSQAPWATILSCSDSRVTPELIFGGLGPGELFIARNAGNLADTDVLGTIEYGAEHLHSPFILVLGHNRCGAVAAACDVVAKDAKLPGSIGKMVAAITPAAKAVQGQPGDFVDNAVRENARRTAQGIRQNSEIVAELEHAGKLKIAYGRFDLDTGVVEFLG